MLRFKPLNGMECWKSKPFLYENSSIAKIFEYFDFGDQYRDGLEMVL